MNISYLDEHTLIRISQNKKPLISKRQITTTPSLILESEMEAKKILYPKPDLLNSSNLKRIKLFKTSYSKRLNADLIPFPELLKSGG